jgi:multicomponent Na+:H+ antiporter subunit G
MILLDLVTAVCLIAAAFFFLGGTVGVLRFPDSLSRLHALTKADNLGLGLVVLGLVFQASSFLVAAKLVLVWVLALVASATGANLIASSVADPSRRTAGSE